MIGTTHLVANFCLGIIFSPSPLALAGIVLGARIPDQIDFLIARRNREVFKKIHRKTSHNLFWWIICFLSIVFIGSEFFSLNTYIFFLWFIFGVILHLILDSFTKSGIPIFPLRDEKIGFRFCYTKGVFDYSLSFFLFLLAIYFLFFENRFDFFKNQLF